MLVKTLQIEFSMTKSWQCFAWSICFMGSFSLASVLPFSSLALPRPVMCRQLCVSQLPVTLHKDARPYSLDFPLYACDGVCPKVTISGPIFSINLMFPLVAIWNSLNTILSTELSAHISIPIFFFFWNGFIVFVWNISLTNFLIF